jgi:hypothetical protein
LKVVKALGVLPIKPELIYSMALQGGLRYEAKTLLDKISGFGQKAQTLYRIFNSTPAHSEAN